MRSALVVAITAILVVASLGTGYFIGASGQLTTTSTETATTTSDVTLAPGCLPNQGYGYFSGTLMAEDQLSRDNLRPALLVRPQLFNNPEQPHEPPPNRRLHQWRVEFHSEHLPAWLPVSLPTRLHWPYGGGRRPSSGIWDNSQCRGEWNLSVEFAKSVGRRDWTIASASVLSRTTGTGGMPGQC